jgi:hypothetical protein
LIKEQRQAGQTYEVNVDDSTYRPIETYLAHMGIDKALIPLMEATPNTTIHWMSHPELQSTHLVTEEVGGESLLVRPIRTLAEPQVGVSSAMLGTVAVPAVYDGYAVNLTIGISASQPGPTLKVSILAQGLPPIAGTTIPFIEVVTSPGRSVRAYRTDLATSQPIFESNGPLEPWCGASAKDLMHLSLGTGKDSGAAAGGQIAEVPVGSVPGLGELLGQECQDRSAASN